MRKERFANSVLGGGHLKKKLNKNKAFTLIELLAIIVILAVIAVITVPLILNMIEDSKLSQAKLSTEGYIDAARYKYITDYLNQTVRENRPTYLTKELSTDGQKAQTGALKIQESGKVRACNIHFDNGYYCNGTKGNVVCSKQESSNISACGQEPEVNEIWDGFITLELFYPENSTERMWMLKDDEGIRDSSNTWTYYTGLITIPYDRVEDIWLKYIIDGEEHHSTSGEPFVSIYEEYITDEGTLVNILYDNRASVKEYQIENEGWKNYTKKLLITEPTLISARVKVNDNVYDEDGELIRTEVLTNTDSYLVMPSVIFEFGDSFEISFDLVEKVYAANAKKLTLSVNNGKYEVKNIYYKVYKTGEDPNDFSFNIYEEPITVEEGYSVDSYYTLDVNGREYISKITTKQNKVSSNNGNNNQGNNENPGHNGVVNPETGKTTIPPGEDYENAKPSTDNVGESGIDEAPIIELKYSDDNKSVEVTVKTDVSYKKMMIKIGDEKFVEYTSPITLTKNTTVEAYYINNDDYSSYHAKEIIDLIKIGSLPTLGFDAKEESDYVLVKINSDTEGILYSFDNMEFSEYKNELKISENKTVYAKVCNDVGCTEKEYSITSFKKPTGIPNEDNKEDNKGGFEPPINEEELSIVIDYNPKVETNSVEVSIKYDEKSEYNTYKIGNGKILEYTGPFTITENTTITAMAKSTVGSATSTITIDNIKNSNGENNDDSENEGTGDSENSGSDGTGGSGSGSGSGDGSGSGSGNTGSSGSGSGSETNDSSCNEPRIIIDPKDNTSTNVLIEIEYSKNSKIKQYGINNNALINYENEFEVYENGTILAHQVCNNDDVKESIYEIKNILPTPKYVFEYEDYYLIKFGVQLTESTKIEYNYNNTNWVPYKNDGIILVKPEAANKLKDQNGNFNIYIKDQNGVEKLFNGDYFILEGTVSEMKDKFQIRWVDIKPESPIIIVLPETITNEVSVNIDYIGNNISQKLYQIIDENGVASSWLPYNGEFKLNHKGTVRARSINNKNVKSLVSEYIVNNVDTEIPTIELSGIPTKEVRRFSLSIKTIDDVGLKTLKYAYGEYDINYFKENGEILYDLESQNIKSQINSLEIDTNGKITFYVIDQAGNVKIEILDVNIIDDTLPYVKITPTYSDELNVNISIEYDDSITKQYKIGNGTWINYTGTFNLDSYTVINNKDTYVVDGKLIVYAKGIDSNANEGTDKLELTIDTDMPNQPIINSKINENLNFVITIDFDTRTDIKNYYSLDNGGSWIEYNGEFELIRGTILAKSIKSNGLYIVNSLNVSILNQHVFYGKYNWHVIREYEGNGKIYQTLLMDAGQLEDMIHCTNDKNVSTDCGYNGSNIVYSWDKSLIQTFINSTFINTLKTNDVDISKIKKEQICIDPSIGGSSTYSYGGYLKEEIDAVDGTCSKFQDYQIRLITTSEYYNLSYYYRNTKLPYEGVVEYGNSGKVAKLDGIKRLSETESKSWLNSSSRGVWSMASYSCSSANCVKYARHVSINDYWTYSNVYDLAIVRPVITIEK